MLYSEEEQGRVGGGRNFEIDTQVGQEGGAPVCACVGQPYYFFLREGCFESSN